MSFFIPSLINGIPDSSNSGRVIAQKQGQMPLPDRPCPQRGSPGSGKVDEFNHCAIKQVAHSPISGGLRSSQESHLGRPQTLKTPGLEHKYQRFSISDLGFL
jgi:hypothetical protein